MKVLSHLGRIAALVALCAVALQLYFALRIALMIAVNPGSTAFERSELWRLSMQCMASFASSQDEAARAPSPGPCSWTWRQTWRDQSDISPRMGRAVIASEDANFANHFGVEWEALEKAWEKNQKAQARAERINERMNERLQQRAASAKESKSGAAGKPRVVQAKVVGGSTITQQLAKNLFLGPERQIARKAQEFLIAFMLEAFLSKERILEIYLNHVEWGQGVFGAQGAAQRYFGVSASALSTHQAARLAVMLPAPKRFEKQPASAYILNRAATIEARMGDVEMP